MRFVLAFLPLTLAGCSIMSSPESSIRVVNLSDLTVTSASVMACDETEARSLFVPIPPGAFSETPVEPGCYAVVAESGDRYRASVRIDVGEGNRVDVRLRPVMFSVN